jgi:hypothetical protein
MVLRTERLFDGLEPLFDGLTSDEQRRLYFLLLVADKLDPREALAFAERIEGFISGKTVATEPNPPQPSASVNDPTGETSCAIRTNNSEAGSGSSRNDSLASAPNEVDGRSCASPNDPASFSGTAVAPKTLDRSMQVEFFKAIARGATNAELAERFGLTKRQAHALRIGIIRRTRAGGSAKSRDREHNAGGVRTADDRRASQQQKTHDEIEVVRFLRQTGDVVVRDGDVFTVNSILQLTLQELVARGNARRLQRGKPAFDFPRVTPPSIESKTNGAGGEQH